MLDTHLTSPAHVLRGYTHPHTQDFTIIYPSCLTEQPVAPGNCPFSRPCQHIKTLGNMEISAVPRAVGRNSHGLSQQRGCDNRSEIAKQPQRNCKSDIFAYNMRASKTNPSLNQCPRSKKTFAPIHCLVTGPHGCVKL